MEELDLTQILSPDEMNDFFSSPSENEPQNQQETQKEKEKPEETTEVPSSEEELFEEPESVGSGNKNDKEKEDTTSDNGGSSPNNSSVYSSIASAFKEDGIFPDLDDETIASIKDAESFAEAVNKQLKAQLDERQRRIDAALNAGIEPDKIRQCEGTLQYLDGIKEANISDESEKGEALRKQLIYNDFINRGYSKERASREVKKSFDGGTDIEDAKEALKSNREYFQSYYDSLIQQAEEEERKYEKQRKEEAEQLKKAMLEEDTVYGELSIDKATRQKAYDAISKPVWKDPETGELYTAVQKYEKEHHSDFMKNLGLLYTLTDGFKNLDLLVKGKVKKEMKKGLRELEHTINNTVRTSDGNLRFANNNGADSEDYLGKGLKLDI